MQQVGNIVVRRFDRRNEVFEVREMTTGKVLVVDLARRTCDCGHFQVERIPCRHVIACCANQRLDWQLYVHDMYKMTEVRKTRYTNKHLVNLDIASQEEIKIIKLHSIYKKYAQTPNKTNDSSKIVNDTLDAAETETQDN
ncbi:hypothetical protein Ahy_A04g018747 [Arachis hypogaea]|uniref:SWIM-type domain-containing protein n=1 Tax=Arachis hypogaea TaxID=3818 RepID=A0A445DEF7_ARAHY|nr:hypothetical protein Ahy_A04g018747 [Arachis hypogaea]